MALPPGRSARESSESSTDELLRSYPAGVAPNQQWVFREHQLLVYRIESFRQELEPTTAPARSKPTTRHS